MKMRFLDHRGRPIYTAPPKRGPWWRSVHPTIGALAILLVAIGAMAAATQLNLATQVQGILSVTNGGTGISNPTAGAVLKGAGSSAMAASALSDNSGLISSTESIDIKSNAVISEIANAGVTGTAVNLLAQLTGAPSTAVKATAGATDGVVGVVVGGAGTSGSAQIAVQGQATCTADNATVAGDFMVAGATTAGDCKDGGGARPTAGQVLGIWLTTTTAGSNGTVFLFGPGVLAYNVAGSINFASAETPSGSINGSNTSFTLAHAPVSTSLQLYRNGVLQTAGAGADYTLASSTITYGAAPLTGDTLQAFYRY